MPDDLYVPPASLYDLLILTARANAYVVSDVEPSYQRRGMIWADISVSPIALKILTSTGWLDLAAYGNGMTNVGNGTGTTTSTGDVSINTITASLPANKNIWCEIVFASSGTGYGRVGLNGNGTTINAASADGTCLARDDATNRGGMCIVYIPRRDTSYANSHGVAWSSRIGTADTIVKVGLTALPTSVDWANIQLRGSCSAASTTLNAKWSVYTF